MGKTAEEIFRKVAKRIEPSMPEKKRDERISRKINQMLEKGVPNFVEIGMMGSMAKKTNLRHSRDFDVFLLFPKEYSHREMSSLGLEYAKKAVSPNPWTIHYAEHPYLRTEVDGHKVDIVPCFKIDDISEKGSSVDRSQLHAKYVISTITPKMRRDVRLLKKFTKTLGVYGAELKIEGFSGYLCELLILQYGSLKKLMEEALDWDRPVIDIESHHKKKDLPMLFDSPMIVIDPIDPSRNVAAVVSSTSLNRFIFACRQFLKKPSMGFFFKKKTIHAPSKLKKLIKKRNTKLLVLNFNSPELVDDILWPQLKKTALNIGKALQINDFEIFGYYYWTDGSNCLILYELLFPQLPCVKKVAGPKVSMRADCEHFVKSHKNAMNLHIEHNRVVAIEERKYCTPESIVKSAIKDPSKIGVPENFTPYIKKLKLLNISQLLSRKYLEVASDYFTMSVL